jgi:hypothetical protein
MYYKAIMGKEEKSKYEITEEEYRQLIKELKERDFDLFYFTFADDFLTKENVEKGLSYPDKTPLQLNYTVNLMAGDLRQIIARIRRKKMNEPKEEKQSK